MKTMFQIMFLIFCAVLICCSKGPDPALDAAELEAVERGSRVWEAEECSACHGDDGRGTVIGPSLEGARQHWTPEHLTRFLLDPVPELASNSRLAELTSQYTVDMPGVSKATEEETRDLAAFVIHGLR
jgi:cytochrome c